MRLALGRSGIAANILGDRAGLAALLPRLPSLKCDRDCVEKAVNPRCFSPAGGLKVLIAVRCQSSLARVFQRRPQDLPWHRSN